MRVIRFKSHENLPEKERKVIFFNHITCCDFKNKDDLDIADYEDYERKFYAL